MSTNRGSQWRKWDLHMHSPYTFLNKYTSTDEEFIDKIIKEQISCIGLTNYFKFDDREYNLKEKLENKGITVFFNLELRLDYQNRDDDCLDFHVIFSNHISKSQINKFLHNMTVNVSGKDKKLIDINETSDFKKAVVNFDKLNDCLKDDSIGLKEKYLIGFLSRGKGNGRSSSNYEKIAKDIHLLIHSTDNEKNVIEDREYWLGFNKPLLQNSDAHSLESIGKKFTWIKAHSTFEGLKQIIYEPEERVRIQVEKPDSKKLDENIIDQLQFKSSNNTGKFTQQPIYLNKNLNVIIGGKSSGKSILLYNIARTLLNTPELGKIFNEEQRTNEYNFRIKTEANPIEDSSFNFEVKTKVPDVSQNRFDYVGKSILPTIKYIPQNYLIKLADPEHYEKGESLNKIVRGLITEKDEFYQKYHSVFIKNVKEKDSIRQGLIRQYFEIKEEIVNLSKELGTKDDKSNIEKIIKHNSERIIAYKEEIGLGGDEIAEYQKIQLELKVLNSKELKINKELGVISDFNNKSLRTLNDIKTQKDTLLRNIETAEIKVDFENKYLELEGLLKSIENYIASYQVKNDDILQQDSKTDNLFRTLITNIEQEKSDKEKSLAPLRKNAEIENNIKQLEESNQLQQQNLDIILGIEGRIKLKKEDLKIKKREIIELYKDNYREYPSVIDNLATRLQALRQDRLIITGKVKFNFPKFRKAMVDISHGGSKSYNKWEILNESLTRTSEFCPKKFMHELNEIFNDIEQGRYAFLTKVSLERALNALLDDYFYDYWEIEYKNDKLGKMSTGKASFVILMIIIGLSESKAPILIDQPEDNLDNRSITEDLVKYLREKKKERQIILVTHNANIVVNADAENIIVANQRGQSDDDQDSDCPYQFDYINGALEEASEKNDDVKNLLKSMGIRQHVTDILEGGKEAFKKREEKYGF